MQQVFDATNRQNTSIYAVDPRGLAVVRVRHQRRASASQQDADEPALRRRTRCTCSPTNTDGRAIVNRNDLAVGHEADHPRLERLLPARLQLVAGADRRQVPQIKVNVKREGCRGPRAQGLLGVHARRRRDARNAPTRGRGAVRGHHRAQRSRRAGARSRPRISGSAPRAARTA